MEITRSQIESILIAEVNSPSGRALLSLVLDRAFEGQSFNLFNTCEKVMKFLRNGEKINAIKELRTLSLAPNVREALRVRGYADYSDTGALGLASAKRCVENMADGLFPW